MSPWSAWKDPVIPVTVPLAPIPPDAVTCVNSASPSTVNNELPTVTVPIATLSAPASTKNSPASVSPSIVKSRAAEPPILKTVPVVLPILIISIPAPSNNIWPVLNWIWVDVWDAFAILLVCPIKISPLTVKLSVIVASSEITKPSAVNTPLELILPEAVIWPLKLLLVNL